MASLDTFQEQFSRLKELEGNKDHLIEALIIRVKELDDDLTQKKLHLEREQETTKLYQSKHHNVEVELGKVVQEIDSNAFVSVLIDGDGMNFMDDIVRSAQQEGGKDAAHRLRTAVCEYVTRELDLPRHIQIRIRIYANTKGLASAYCHDKVLDSPVELDLFVRGFNMGHPMCDFVDAGNGKECADAKLKAWFSLDMADVQCKAVVFGGSADDGYARLLAPYSGDESKSNRVVLIEGPPFAKELDKLKDKFLVARFPGLFRTTKLTTRRVSFSTTPPPTPSPKATSYAATIANLADNTAVGINGLHHASMAITIPTRKDYPVLRNSRGQRLDAIINPPQSLVSVLRNKKLCNQYHILGECYFSNCSFLHGGRLGEKEIEARRLLLRQTPCPSRLECREKNCLHGHQCPDRACMKIDNGCYFTREMHNVDRT